MDTWIQGYKDTGIQGYRDTWIQGYVDTWIQGNVDTGIHGYMYTCIHGYKVWKCQMFHSRHSHYFFYSNFDFFDSFYLILVSFIFSRSQTKSLNHFLRHTRSNEVITATSSIDISNSKDSELGKRFCTLNFRFFYCSILFVLLITFFPAKLTLFPKAGW